MRQNGEMKDKEFSTDVANLEILLIDLRWDDLTLLELLVWQWLLGDWVGISIWGSWALLILWLILWSIWGLLLGILKESGLLGKKKKSRDRLKVLEPRKRCRAIQSCIPLPPALSVSVVLLTRRSSTHCGYCLDHLLLFATRSALSFHCQLFQSIPKPKPTARP